MAQSSRRPDPYLLELEPWTGAAVETLRLSTHSFTTSSSDTPANTIYDGRLIDPGTFSDLLFSEGATSGRANISTGFAEAASADDGLDSWIDYGWDGRNFTLKSLSAADAPVTSSETLRKGRLAGINGTDPLHRFGLRFRDALFDLTLPLLTRRYLGTTTGPGATAEGGSELTGQIVPYAWGTNVNVPGKLVNQYNLLYQFAGNAQTSIVVYEGGLALANIGDFGALSSLVNSTVAAGQYATCLSQGIVMLGTSPSLSVTADLVEGETSSLRSAARVSQRMLVLTDYPSGDIDNTTFDTFHTFNSSEVGQYVSDDKVAIDAISEVMDSVGGVLNPTRLGILQAVAFAAPSATATDTLTLRDLSISNSSMTLFSGPASDGQGIPAWSVLVNYGRIWQTQAGGDLYGSVSDARKSLLASQWQQVSAEDVTVKTAHLSASQLTFNTLLTSQSAVTTEAARRLALYKVRRDRIAFPLAFTRGKDIEIGQTVKVQLTNRLGYSAGRNMVVIGREDDYAKRRIILTLWG